MATIFEDAKRLGGPLSVRERFRRTLHYQKVDRIPFFEFGYWDDTLPRWHTEGLPPEINNEGKAYAYFGIEGWGGVPANVQLTGNPYEPETIEETDEYIVTRDGVGTIAQQNKRRTHTIPHFIEYGIKSREDWERFKPHLQPTLEGRVNPSFYEKLADYLGAEHPICAPIGSMIGVPRNWLGFERCAMLAYDDPDLLDEIVETLCQCVVVVLEELCSYVEFDFGAGWEDICFNSGPLLSPAVFRETIAPHMEPVMKMLRQHGIDIIFTDCDGNIQALIPLWLGVGLNCMFPYEINAGNDVVQARKEFGRDLLMLGGFDKFALLDSKEAVLAQFRRLEPVLEEGGFIPHIDHRCPDGVAFEMYQYYIREKLHFLGWAKDEVEQIPGLQAS